jgi:rod shape-determining protein MreD
MNPLVVCVAAWIGVGMDVGLRDAFQLGHNDIAPRFTLILVAFVSAWARRTHLMWFGVLLGIVIDLLTNVALTNGDTATVIGPHALGYLAAAYTAYILRAWMYRKHALAIAFLSAASALVGAVITLAILKVRAMYDPVLIGPASVELGVRSATALYTGIVAVPVAAGLNWVRPLFRFPAQGRGGGGGMRR